MSMKEACHESYLLYSLLQAKKLLNLILPLEKVTHSYISF